MLILERKVNESVILRKNGEELGRVVLMEARKQSKARIGFIFPRDVEIVREEIDGRG